MKAMIFAAGLGTRLKPLTDTMPKALVPVAGKPLIQHVIEKLTAAGYDDFVVNIHHFADMLENWLMDVPANANSSWRQVAELHMQHPCSRKTTPRNSS